METLKFKTNINCGGCVAKVTPVLNNLEGVTNWTVNTADQAKTLTVSGDENVTAQQIIQAIKKIGFQSESI